MVKDISAEVTVMHHLGSQRKLTTYFLFGLFKCTDCLICETVCSAVLNGSIAKLRWDK